MRKIINGKAYDTKTATTVATWGNNHSMSDFHYCEKTLYRTPKGGWFLYGEGGALSEYATTSGDGRGYGERIDPMTPAEAKEWLEEHDFAEESEQYFGPAEDAGGDDSHNFNLRGIPAAIHEKIKAKAEASGKSMNQFMLDAVTAAAR